MTKTLLMTYEGHSIQFRDDGWFNATAAASQFDKEPTAWLRQRDTVEYIIALASHLGVHNSGFLTELNEISKLESSSSVARTKLLKVLKNTGLVSTKAGAPETGGGTWMHPKLGVAFARWLDVRFAVWCDTQIDTIIHGTPEASDWQRLRHEAASSYKVMSDVLLERRTEDGKETKPYHYANEAKLVNWALTGEYAPLDRANLSTADLDMLAKLEARNAVLLAKGASRDLRKELLTAMVESKRAKLTVIKGNAD